MHAFVEQSPAARFGRINKPGAFEFLIEPMTVAMAHPHHCDLAQIAAVDTLFDRLRDRIKPLGKALHEHCAGALKNIADFQPVRL